MTAIRVRLELNREGVAALMKSPEVQAELAERGGRVLAAAGEGHELKASVGRNRARVKVFTRSQHAKNAEAKRRNLTLALEAGR